MIRSAAIGTVILFLVMSGPVVSAATEYQYHEGICPTGRIWWSVTRYENGNPVFIEGRNCKGERYYRHIQGRVQTGDPTAGMTATHTGLCDDGSTTSGWHSVIQYDAGHIPNWMGGRSCAGSYWLVTAFKEEPDPGEELQ